MENRANRRTNDKNVNGQLDKKSSSKSRDISNMSQEQKLRKFVGVGQAGRVAKAAFVATLAFTGMSGAMADQFQNVSGSDNATDLSLKGGSTISRTETALYNLGMRDQDIQNFQQQKQKQKERQLAKEAHEKSDVPEGLSKLFEEIPEEKIATLKAVAEKAGKNSVFADRVRKLLEKNRQLSEQESSERRQLATNPDGPCLQGGPPPWDPPTFVTARVLPVEGGGTAASVTYDLNTINACLDTVTNVQFVDTKFVSCPAGCTQESFTTKPVAVPGDPSAINPHRVSTASKVDTIYCSETGTNTPVAPTGLTVSILPEGIYNGGVIQGTLEVFGNLIQ